MSMWVRLGLFQSKTGTFSYLKTVRIECVTSITVVLNPTTFLTKMVN